MSEEKGKEKEGDGAAAAEPPKKSRKKLLVIAAGVVFLVAAIGAPGVYFFLLRDQDAVEELAADSAKEGPHGKLEGSHSEPEYEEGEQALGAIVPLDTFVVNLSGGKYIRVQVQVEFETPDLPKRFYGRIVPIRDAIISLLTQQTAEELGDSKGKEKLRVSIRTKINDVMRREDVRKVYFTQFVIQ